MSLQDRGTGAYDFPAFAPRVAGGTERAQAPPGGRLIQGFRQSTLAGCEASAIDVEDEEVVALSVPQSSWLLLFRRVDGPANRAEKGSVGTQLRPAQARRESGLSVERVGKPWRPKSAMNALAQGSIRS